MQEMFYKLSNVVAHNGRAERRFRCNDGLLAIWLSETGARPFGASGEERVVQEGLVLPTYS